MIRAPEAVPMIIILKKSQLALFDTPVQVATHVRKDGVVVQEHTRIQKKGVHPAHAPRHRRLDAFIEKHGGVRSLAGTLSSMRAEQQERLFDAMAKLDGLDVGDVRAKFPDVKPAPESVVAQEAPAVSDKADSPQPVSVKTPSVEDSKAKLQMLRDFLETQPDSKSAPAWKEKIAELEAIVGKDEPKAKSAPAPVDQSGWSEPRKAAYALRKEYEAVNHLSAKAVGAFKRKLRALAKKTPETDEQAVALLDSLATKVWGTDYDPKVAALEFAKPAAAPAPEPVAEAAPTPVPAIEHDRASSFGVPAGISKADRRAINSEVVKLLERKGPYSGGDRALMRQYSGNGGCGDSLNEYYTDPDVARAMWDVIAGMGLTHGTALEPSCGAGVYLHTAPAGFKVTGVELDPVSAGVAAALHGDRHEVHTASLERFATMDDRQFDVVIGNPPYGPRGFLAKDDKKYISTAEQYFVDTSLDKCKPGGIVALVVPTGIMDSKSGRSFRQGLLARGEFLGAQRMPNTAFEHSHTEVTTDVIYLRKRPDDVGHALATCEQDMLKQLGVWDDDFLAGSYFTGRGAGNVLGEMGPGWRAQAGMGDDITVNGSMAGVPAALAAFEADGESRPASDLTVQDVLDALPEGVLRDRAIAAAQRPRPYANTAKAGDVKTVDGVQYILQGDPPRWHRMDEFMQDAAIVDATTIATDIDRLFTGQAVNRPALEAAVRAYVAKYGIPADNKDLMTAAMADKTLYRLVGAVNRQGELSDAVLGKAPRTMEGGFDATAEAMALEHAEGEFAAAALAERLGKDAEEVEDQLAADPRYAALGDGRWSTMALYLTGELWPKLDAARAQIAAGSPLKDKLQDQARRLEEAIAPKSLEDVEIAINSAFVPLHVLSAYLNWRLFDSEHANKWTRDLKPVEVTFGDGVYHVAGGNQYGDSKLLDKYLNRTGIKKEDELPRIEAMNEEFKSWLCQSTYRDAVEDLYNRKFRGFAARTYSDEPIDVPGLTTDRDVRNWRWSSLRRSLADGKGIIADDVGLGKTLGGLLLVRMAKVQGTAKRAVTVVPKSVLANWFAEANTWFPGARVLTIGANFGYDKLGNLVGRDDDATERKRKYHDLTQNDYDFVFISEPAFEEVDLNPETKERYYGDDFWVQRGDSMGNAGDKRRKAIKERYDQYLAQREFQDRTDAVYFDDLGIDMLLADEMHHQKNLYAARARFGENPKFLGGQGLSNRALDFNLKTRWVRDRNSGKNVYGLTATPTKNSPLEIYSMLSHIAPEAFENIGIRNSEEFLDRFCEFENDKVLGTNGAIEDALVVSGFKNLDELRNIMFRYIDRRTAVDVGLKLPERQQRTHVIDMSKAQEGVYADLRAMAEESSGKRDATGDSHIFSIMDKMNKAALDLELLGAAHAGAHSPKIASLAREVIEGAKDGGQIVFCESVPVHDKIVRALVDSGIARDEIGVINAQVAGSAVKRQNIADKFNAGKLKVVIGNCVMAEGLNLQKTTRDIHELDIPWEPATVQQRLGRGIRQGNLNDSVRTHSYLARGSFDGYRYQAVHAKRDWQDLLWNGGDRVENLSREGNLTLDDMRIMLAADPDEARKKFEEDKTAAMQRYETAARSDAQKQYVKFQDLHRSYQAQKSKDTKSAQRLRDRLEAAKTALFNNRYWPAKSALDSASDVLVHPSTGTLLGANVGLQVGDEKTVVTGVNMRAGTVSLRRYADASGAKTISMPLAELHDAQPYKFDADEEAKETTEKFAAAAAENINTLESWEDLTKLPSSIIEANRDRIQEQVKNGMKDYKFRMPYGQVPMVHRETGKLEAVDEHSARQNHQTHDYLLPSDGAKEQAIQAWLDARRAATIDSKFQAGGKRSKSFSTAARKYDGARYDSRHVNPFRDTLKRLGGDGGVYGQDGPLLKQAKQRLETEQVERIRRAPNMKDALDALLPLAKVEGRNESFGDAGMTAKYPAKALTMLWARARHLGELNKPMAEVFDKKHGFYAISRRQDMTVHNALLGMALASGHRDLAEAMIESSKRHNPGNDHTQTVRVLGQGWNHSTRTLQNLLHHAEKAGLADQTIGQLRPHGLSGAFQAAGGGYGYNQNYTTMGQNQARKLRDVIAEQMGTAK